MGAKIYGYRYITSDKKQIVQARLDGFTFSRLKPYIKWNDLRDEAHKLWRLYQEATSPESITRVALRYINNLNIPLPIRDFGDYLTAPPTIPEGLPQGVGSFLTRVVMLEPSIGANAIITQALEQIAPGRAPIILDIDVFKLQEKGIEEKEAWDTIEKLRHFKNKIFFKSITNRLKEMYQ
ncbi:MAG: TIGR04255 family protein [Thermodesulfobacteriota bacterium]